MTLIKQVHNLMIVITGLGLLATFGNTHFEIATWKDHFFALWAILLLGGATSNFELWRTR